MPCPVGIVSIFRFGPAKEFLGSHTSLDRDLMGLRTPMSWAYLKVNALGRIGLELILIGGNRLFS